MDAPLTLPRAWVERIFLRLQGVYGSQFTGKYLTGEIVDGRDVGYENAMHVWGEELRGFSDDGESIAYALKNLDAKFPPNVREFIEICRRSPRAELPALPQPAADPVKVAAFASDAKKVTESKRDLSGWARRPKSVMAFGALLDLVNAGESHFEEILNDLREAGHVVGNSLVNRWNGMSWERV